MPNTATVEHSTDTFVAGGRVVRVVETEEQVELRHGGAKVRVSLLAARDGELHLHVKGVNCFVARTHGTPTGAVSLERDDTLQLYSPERRLLAVVRCGFGSPGRPGRMFRFGASSVRVPQPAVLIDFEERQELLLIQQAEGTNANAEPNQPGAARAARRRDDARDARAAAGAVREPIARLSLRARRRRPADRARLGPLRQGVSRRGAWLESKTAFRRDVAIKLLQRGVSVEDGMRFQMEKELIERVQGHPNIIGLYASGEARQSRVHPRLHSRRVENDFIILERCDLSLEERLKGSRNRGCATICSPIRCASGSSACSSTCCRSPPPSSTRTSCAAPAIATSSRRTCSLRLPDPRLRGATARRAARRLQRRQAARRTSRASR